MIYTVNSFDSAESIICVGPDFFIKNELGKKTVYGVSAGQRTKNVKIITDNKIKEGEIRLSRPLIGYFHIPDGLSYQIKCTEDNIKIGPVIGLLMGIGKKSLTKGKLRKLICYTKVYPKIKGLLFVFCEEGIDFRNRLIEGYYYSPDRRPQNNPWEKAALPFPDSIFQRTELADDKIEKLKIITNNHLFNSKYFNKWAFWQMASKRSEVKEHIPFTERALDFDGIDKMLDTYRSIYLKPINGTLARGLIKAYKERGKYTIKQNDGGGTLSFGSPDRARDYLQDVIESRSYIAQQALFPITVNNRPIDFRVIMQKDESLDWKCTGIVAFIGKHGGICSNWGYESTFEDILAEALNYSQQEIYIKKQEITRICKYVCHMLEETGENYGDFGFDVLIDKSLKVWVLEVNKRHYHTVPLWIHDEQTFYAVKSNPIKYAAASCGFDVY